MAGLILSMEFWKHWLYQFAFIFLFFPLSGKVAAQADTAKQIVVLELFTSEGCSTCPPAEETVKKLAKEFKSNLAVLAFHVDYWNRLGWKDVFSKPEFTDRQKQYASYFKTETIYTPQVFINGKYEFVGSDYPLIRKQIKESLRIKTDVKFNVNVKKVDSANLFVTYSNSDSAKYVLSIALVLNKTENKITAGENNGKRLSHINIVTEFVSVTDSAGTVNIRLPSGDVVSDYSIIAFLQSKTDLRINSVFIKSVE